MKRKYPILLVALAALGFMATTVFPRITTESKEEVLMQTVVQFLARYHYSPSEIDDEFSRNVFTTYLNSLDGARLFFTQKDIDALEMHRLQIDDQAKAGQYGFFEEVGKHWLVSRERSQRWYRDILSQPLDFENEESFERLDDDDEWLADETALQQYWKRYLERDVLGRIVNRQEQLKKDTTGAEQPTFAELEEEYRTKVLENFDDWFQRMENMSRETRVSQYLSTMTNSHDPHTEYYAPREREDFDIRFRGRLEGIGASLTTEDGYAKVASIVVGGPAWKADELKADDLITAVRQNDQEEAVEVKGMNLDDIISMIRGPKGSIVHLTILKPEGEEQIIQITRDVVVVDERFARSLIIDDEDAGEKIGYIWLPSFYADFEDPNGRFSAQDVEKEINKLKEVGVDGIILDLRSNGGGALADAIDMSGFFIPEGPIVQVEGRGGRTQVQRDKDETVQYDGPLVVMVNQGSASASEILAAAMQDYQRAVIIGSQQTFGKGTVQRFYDLDRVLPGYQDLKPLGSMKMTTQKFFRINGGSTQLRGVASDIVLPDSYSYLELGEKRQDNPLAWTEIDAADFSQDVFRITPQMMNELRRRSEVRTSQNDVFASIDENAQRIRRQRDRNVFPLRYEAYLEVEQLRRAEAEQFGDLFEEIVNPNVANLEVDLPYIQLDESRVARNDDFIDKVSRDVYIQESIQVLHDLIDLGSGIAANDE